MWAIFFKSWIDTKYIFHESWREKNIDEKSWSVWRRPNEHNQTFFLHNFNFCQGLLNIILFHKEKKSTICCVIEKGDFLQKGILKFTLHESFSLQNKKNTGFQTWKNPKNNKIS